MSSNISFLGIIKHAVMSQITGHRGSSMMAAVCCVIVVIEAFVHVPVDMLSRCAMALQLVLSALIAVFPMPAVSALILLYSLAEILPVGVVCSVVVVFPALGFLSYLVSSRWSLLAVTILTVATTTSYVRSGTVDAYFGGIFMGLLYSLAVILGIILRRKDEARLRQARIFRDERYREEIKRLKNSQRLASAIHDSVTRELSSISMLSWDMSNPDVPVASVRTAMNTIYDDAQGALNHMHGVIDLLEQGQPDTYEVQRDDPPAIDQIRSVVDKEQNALSKTGYSGKSSVHGECCNVGAETMALVLDLLREIYANIIRHADPRTDAYTCVVHCSPNRIIIAQTNSVRDETHRFSNVRHGRGLTYHKKAIERCGGSMHTRLSAGQWTISAEIPVSSANTDESTPQR